MHPHPVPRLTMCGATLRPPKLHGMLLNKGEGKGKVHRITGHEGPEGEDRYSYTLSLALALDGVGSECTPRPL